jgi:pyruvate/2-oxoglutarate dehydrogenase complex dihydrolipoamide dehydrogenase (E3) component
VRDYQLVVIGGGAGGMGAARAGVRRGLETLLVSEGELGGDCTFTGCVPSKALISASARGDSFGDAMAQVRRAIDTVAATETEEVFRREGIDVVRTRARFTSPNEVDLDGKRIAADRFVVATGAHPAVPPIPGLREAQPFTSDNVWSLTAAPASLAVLGGGAIGCELAQAFRRFGTEVTIVEALDRLVPREEPESSQVLHEVFAEDGIDVRAGQKVTSVEGGVLHLDGGDAIKADAVLAAFGRSPNTADLGLDAAGVELDDRGFVKTDEYLATTAGSIWAVGDVAGSLQFTHAADEMGRIAVGNAFGKVRKRRFRAGRTPWVTFTEPEIGRVGITEAEAPRGARVAYLPMTEVDRAVADGRTSGFVKIIVGPRFVLGDLGGGRILGATVAAARGGELIHEASIAMRTGMFPARLVLATHAYPTWSMAIPKALGQLFVEIEGRRARPAGSSSDTP